MTDIVKTAPASGQAGQIPMREFLRLLLWLVAALYCAIATVILAYCATFWGAVIFRFSIEEPTAMNFLHGSMAFFAVMSCAFLFYLGIKMGRGDL